MCSVMNRSHRWYLTIKLAWMLQTTLTLCQRSSLSRGSIIIAIRFRVVYEPITKHICARPYHFHMQTDRCWSFDSASSRFDVANVANHMDVEYHQLAMLPCCLFDSTFSKSHHVHPVVSSNNPLVFVYQNTAVSQQPSQDCISTIVSW